MKAVGADTVMTRLVTTTAVLLAVAGALSAADAEKEFASSFGADLKRVAATADAADDIQLAAKMTQAAAKSDNEELIVLLCERAYELASRTAAGYSQAVSAMAALMDKLPERKIQALEKILTLGRARYSTARGSERVEAAQGVVAVLAQLAEAKASAGQQVEAIRYYRWAVALASQFRSIDAKPLRAALGVLLARERVNRRIADLKARIKANPDDIQSHRKLFRAHLLELGDVEAAAEHAAGAGDDDTRARLALAAAEPETISDAACLDLAEWYAGLAGQAGVIAKPILLRRAKEYFEFFLDRQAAPSALSERARDGLTKVQAELAKFVEAAPTPVAIGKWIDLLKLANVRAKGRRGRWRKTDGKLLIRRSPRARLPLPLAPAGRYAVEAKFVRTKGAGSVCFILPVGETAVNLFFSGAGGTAHGLLRVKDDPKKSVVKAEKLANDTEHTVAVSVVLSGDDVEIKARLNGKPVVSWKGPQAQLDIGDFGLADNSVVGLRVHHAAVTFTRLRLRMTSGKAKIHK